ncbi:MAG: HAMP domain-containing sensor histidine kinase [bacterium]
MKNDILYVMVKMKTINQLDIIGHCRRYGLTLWQCPQFLFLIMGLFVIFVAVASYIIGTQFIEEPEIVAFVVLILSAVLFTLAVLIVRSFERLAEASRMKTEFVSIVSHQLRAPLSNMKWAMEYIFSGRLGKVEAQQITYLKIIKENNDRMRELVEDLLMVSRIEQNRLPQDKQEFSLREMIEKKVALLSPYLRATNTKIETSFSVDGGLVFSDPSQVGIILDNLIDNAIRYSEDKGSVGIKTETKDNFVYCEIKDDGVGIPVADQRYIFEKFFRSENALKKETQGSGLGLYIAKAIVERAGGKIGFSSQEEQGSVFWFTIPIYKQDKKS